MSKDIVVVELRVRRVVGVVGHDGVVLLRPSSVGQSDRRTDR